MKRVRHLSEETLNKVAAQIGESFWDYPYADGEGGLKAFIPSRQAMDEYMKAFVIAGMESGTLYSTDGGEGYILLTSSDGEHPNLKSILKMAKTMKHALGGWKQLSAFLKTANAGGEPLEKIMKRQKKPYVKVEMLIVTKEYQGQGYMRKLMGFAYAMAAKKNASVILDTDAKGKCDRYLHLGMKIERTRTAAGFLIYDLIRETPVITKKNTVLPVDNPLQPLAVVGTNSWGSAAYGKVLRGSSVDESVIKQTVETALQANLLIFDTAQDYGLGEGQKMIGRLCPERAMISSKFTPGKNYTPGQVRSSFEKDLQDFDRDSVDIYWLHLPNQIEENLSEMIALYKEGKIRNIGVSNFSLEECRIAEAILDRENIPLYGVQNHYSLLAREWEKNGLVEWCRENGVQFWAWAVLEEGMLVPPKAHEKQSVMKLIFRNKRKKLAPLYRKMQEIGKAHGLTVPQVAMAFCSSKGIIPICGCRRPYQIQELAQAVSVTLSADEIRQLEQIADSLDIRILGEDMFRFAVKS